MMCDATQADSSGGATTAGQQLGVGKKKDADKPRASAYTSLNDLRRIFDLPPIALPSTMPDENDPTNDFEAVNSIESCTPSCNTCHVAMSSHTDACADDVQGLLSWSSVLTRNVSVERQAC